MCELSPRPLTETYLVVSGPGAFPLPLPELKHLQGGLDKRTCGYCGKVFSRVEKKKRHEKEIHSTVKFKCPVCLKFYNTARVIARHLTQIHGQKVGERDVDQYMVGRDDA